MGYGKGLAPPAIVDTARAFRVKATQRVHETEDPGPVTGTRRAQKFSDICKVDCRRPGNRPIKFAMTVFIRMLAILALCACGLAMLRASVGTDSQLITAS